MKKVIILLLFVFSLALFSNVNAFSPYKYTSSKDCINDYMRARENVFKFCESSLWRNVFKSTTYTPLGFLTNMIFWTRDKIDWVFDDTCKAYTSRKKEIYWVCKTTIDNYYRNIDIQRKKKSCPKKYPWTIYNPKNDKCICPYWDPNWWNTTVKNWCYYPMPEFNSDLTYRIIKILDKRLWKIDNKKEIAYTNKLINTFWKFTKKLYYAKDEKNKKLREKYWDTIVNLWVYLSVKLKNDTWIYSNKNPFLKYYHVKMKDKLNIKLK